MNPLTGELSELAKHAKEYLQTHFKEHTFIPSTQEVCNYFKLKNEIQGSPYPFKPKDPVQPEEPPLRITPKPTLPPIQKPLPPPIRKLPTPPQPPPSETNGQKKSTEVQPLGFTLEPLPEGKVLELSEFKVLYANRFPNHPILGHPLEDSEAHSSAQQDTSEQYPQVVLLSFSGNPKISAFLQNLARSIQLRWKLKTNVIAAHQWEQEKAWEGLLTNSATKLILASDYGLQTLPELLKHYKEAPKQSHHFLGNKPLLLLSDITVYMRETHLKLTLWQAISAQFK